MDKHRLRIFGGAAVGNQRSRLEKTEGCGLFDPAACPVTVGLEFGRAVSSWREFFEFLFTWLSCGFVSDFFVVVVVILVGSLVYAGWFFGTLVCLCVFFCSVLFSVCLYGLFRLHSVSLSVTCSDFW